MATKTPQGITTRRITGAHLIQSLMAAVYIFLVFIVMNSFHSNLTVASLGASAFIAFSFPHAQSSRPRYLIGGYCVGALCGVVFFYLASYFEVLAFLPFPPYIVSCAVAVCFSMLLMTVLNFEHPPSAALTIAVATAENPVELGFAAIGCICVLSLIKRLLKRWMKNL